MSATANPGGLRWTGVCIDCSDAEEMARFYEQVLGWEITARDGDHWIKLADPDGGVGLNIQAEEWYEPPTWPEQPGGKDKMLHFEIRVDDLDAAIAHTIAAGGRVAEHQPENRAQDRLRIMLDPAGHPFCLYID